MGSRTEEDGGISKWQRIDSHLVHFIQVLKDTRVISIMISGFANINPEIGVNMAEGKRGIETVDTHNFILNAVFRENSKEYATKPVRAAKYQPGMESGFMVYYVNKPSHENGTTLHEGMKFFDTEAEAWDYINADNRQYAEVNGELLEFKVVYDCPVPVLHRIETNIEKKTGCIRFKDDRVFISDEAAQYDFFVLDGDVWIIHDSDGNIRVWSNDYDGENFFGLDNDIVYEKSENAEYIKVAV